MLRSMIDKYMNEYLFWKYKNNKTGAELRIISIEKLTEDAVAVEKSGRCILFYFGENRRKTRCLN